MRHFDRAPACRHCGGHPDADRYNRAYRGVGMRNGQGFHRGTNEFPPRKSLFVIGVRQDDCKLLAPVARSQLAFLPGLFCYGSSYCA